jgi:hypothetical protein
MRTWHARDCFRLIEIVFGEFGRARFSHNLRVSLVFCKTSGFDGLCHSMAVLRNPTSIWAIAKVACHRRSRDESKQKEDGGLSLVAQHNANLAADHRLFQRSRHSLLLSPRLWWARTSNCPNKLGQIRGVFVSAKSR